jgi:hypothetical protein
MKTTAEPIPFAGSALGRYRHVCAFFNSPEEEYATLLPFVRDGIERGERALHIVRSQFREHHLDHLRGAGIDVATAQQRGQLEVSAPEGTYLPGGRFDKEAVSIVLRDALKKGMALGFPITRLIAHAEIVVEDWSNLDEWIEYEAQLNDVLRGYDPVICTYDASALNGSLMVEVLRTHPVAIIGGRLYENPFFVPPHEFLEQVRQRGSTSGRYGRMTALTASPRAKLSV